MTDDNELGRAIDASVAFDEDVSRLLEAGWNVSSPRLRICMALCRAAFEHAVSQRVLFSTGENNGTALALIRLHFEATVRAAWVLHAATDKWVEEFSKPVPIGDLSEPQLGPDILAMVNAIALQVPEMAQEFRKLHATVKAMHSFVHGGVHLVVHALRGYPADKLLYVLLNRNYLTLILCNVIVFGSNKPQIRGAVGHLVNAHSRCLPPVTQPMPPHK